MSQAAAIEALVELGYERASIRLAHSGPDHLDVLVVPLKDPTGWDQEWRVLRGQVDETGYWPLAIDQPFYGEREVLRFEFYGAGSGSARDALTLAAGYDPDEAFVNYEPFEHDRTQSSVPYLLSLTSLDEDSSSRWSREAVAELGETPSLRDAERWLVAKYVEHPQVLEPAYGLWAEMGAAPEWMALVPDTDPINGLAYVSTFQSAPVRNLATCRRWVRDHQVELVGAVGCSYLFEVPEPVSDPAEAWRLAVELLELWQCSAGGAKSAVTPLELAQILTQVTQFDGTEFP